MIRFTNEEFTQLITYMSGQYGIDLSKKKILAECRMNGELEKRGNISMGEYMRQMEMEASMKSIEQSSRKESASSEYEYLQSV